MPLGERGRTYALFTIVVLGCAAGALVQTAMNAMLAVVEADFGVDASIGQWLTTSYMLVLGVTVPTVTYFSKRFSIRSLVIFALSVFAIACVVSAASPTFGVLLGSRIAQAIATGLTMPLLQTIAVTRFPEGRHGTAMGISGIAMGFAPNVGPLVGGVVIATMGWRAFYVVLVVFTGVLVALAFLLVERPSASGDGPHDSSEVTLDAMSVALSTFGFGGLLMGFSNASSTSLSSPLVWAPILVGAAFLAAFIARQRTAAHPLIHLSIFSSWRYRASFVAQVCLFASFMGITLVVPLFVEGCQGGTSLEAGYVFIPTTVLALFVNPLAGVLADKFGARPVVVTASACLFLGGLSMVFVTESTPIWLLALEQGVRGGGVSALIGPLNSWGMKGLAREVTMDGSAFFVACRQACASLGTALMVLAITLAGAALGDGAAVCYRLAFAISATFALVVFVTAVWKIRD